MSLLTKVGSFVKNTATGSQSVTGVGFQPKAIIFWTTGTTAGSDVWTVFSRAGVGFTAGSSNSYSVCGGSQNNVMPSKCDRRIKAKAIMVSYGDNTLFDEADLTSFDGDGFTLNWTTQLMASPIVVNYLALGGTDLTNAIVLNWTSPTTATTKSVTGAGFKPDIVFHLAAGADTVMPTAANTSSIAFGVMNKHGQQWANHIQQTNNVTPTATDRLQQTDACLVYGDEAESTREQAAFASMDADGFTLGFSTIIGASAYQRISLCLKGPSSKISSFRRVTSTISLTETIARLGFTPKAVLTTNVRSDPMSTVTTHAAWGIGATDGTNHRAAALVDVEASNPSSVASIGSSTASILAASQAQGYMKGPVTLGFDGFTVPWVVGATAAASGSNHDIDFGLGTTIAVPAAARAGDYAVLQVTGSGVTTFTTPSGWSILEANRTFATGHSTIVYGKRLVTADEGATITITASSVHYWTSQMVAVRDALTPTMGANSASAGGAYSTSLVTGAMTPTQGNLFLCGVGATNNDSFYSMAFSGHTAGFAGRIEDGIANGVVGGYMSWRTAAGGTSYSDAATVARQSTYLGFSMSFAPQFGEAGEVCYLALGDAGANSFPTRVA